MHVRNSVMRGLNLVMRVHNLGFYPPMAPPPLCVNLWKHLVSLYGQQTPPSSSISISLYLLGMCFCCVCLPCSESVGKRTQCGDHFLSCLCICGHVTYLLIVSISDLCCDILILVLFLFYLNSIPLNFSTSSTISWLNISQMFLFIIHSFLPLKHSSIFL